jgi:hypothetical protein
MARKASPRKLQRKGALRPPEEASADGLYGQTPSPPITGSRRDLAIFSFLLLVLLVIYNSNFRTIGTDDSFPARFLPFSLLLDHSFYLDQWILPRIKSGMGVNGAYYAAMSHGHWMSAYPIITPLVVTPLYVLPALWLSRQSPPLYPNSPTFLAVISYTMEKFSASLIAALSGAVLFLALRKITSRNVSLVVALIYGLASNTWTISSQALWRHGLTELCFAFLLWALFSVPGSPRAPFWAGLASAVATANKPLEAILIVPFLIYFGRRGWKNVLQFLAPLAVLGSLVFAYNLYFFSRFLGAVTSPTLLGTAGSAQLSYLDRFVAGVPGSLISPSRGLLVYMPWTAFAFWGGARLWKEETFGWSRLLIVSLVAVFVINVVGTNGWWAGWCFGPRYLTDLLPFLAWFLVPVWTSIRARPVLRVVFAATVAFALWVQVVGAFYYPEGYWDASPVNVDVKPERVWDWSDSQVLRSWRAHPASPFLLHNWEILLRARSAVPQ